MKPLNLVGNIVSRKRRCGNPNWGKGAARIRVGLCAFDVLVIELGLVESDYLNSMKLISWVKKNCHYRYVPEWLLKKLELVPREGIASKEWQKRRGEDNV